MYMYWLRNVEKDQDTRKITQKSRSVRYFLERRHLFVITRYTEKLLYTAERMFQTSFIVMMKKYAVYVYIQSEYRTLRTYYRVMSV